MQSAVQMGIGHGVDVRGSPVAAVDRHAQMLQLVSGSTARGQVRRHARGAHVGASEAAVVAGASVVRKGAQMHRVHPASTTRVRPEPTGQESGQVGGGHVDWGGRVTTGDVGTATHEHVRH